MDGEEVPYSDTLEGIKQHAAKAEEHYDKLMKAIKERKMGTEVLNLPSGNDGMFGSGGGMVGGLVLGSLLRNNGNLLGGNNGVEGYGNNSGGWNQPMANMSIMGSLGDIKQAVALSTATIETSNATQTGTLSGAIAGSTAANMLAVNSLKDVVNANALTLMQQLNGVQSSVDKNAWAVTTAVSNDGDKTRALITHQYEATLNRQLSDANAAIIELRSDQRFAERSRGVEVTTTNNINQAQAQQQQQVQFQDIRRLVGDLANDLQYIRATNQAINIGAGTQMANPTNTNTNVKA